jgi:Fe-S-cluster formation regulator IscX/YfhJ
MNENAVEGEVLDNGKELAPSNVGLAPTDQGIGTGMSVVEFEKQMSDNLRKFEIFEQTTLKRTTAADWLVMGKGESARPYLSEPGCRRLMPLWGINIFSDATTFEIDIDPDDPTKKTVLCTIVASCLKLGITAEKFIGTAAVDDAFMRARGGFDSVKKKSYANAVGRAVRSILGLGNITWDKLKAAGIKREDCGSVEFKEKGKYQDTELDPAKIQHLKNCIMLLPDVDNDLERAKEKLVELTSYTYEGKEVKGVDRTDKIRTPKSLDYAIKDAEKQLKAAGVEIPQ